MRKLLIIVFCISLGAAAARAGQQSPVVNKRLFQINPKSAETDQSAPSLQYQPVTAVRIQKPVFKNLKNLRPIIPEEAVEQPQGPDPSAALDLSDIIDDPALLADLGVVCGWDSHLLLQDKAAAHVFYYIPRAFLLKRDADGYRFNVQYNSRTEAGQPSVMITAELQAPHQTGDIHLLKSILRQAFDLKPTDPLSVKALPGLGATADLQALSTGLTLAPERIHLEPPGHLKQVFRLTLSLTQDETEEVLAQIAHGGLVGRLNVVVEQVRIPVPIRIQYTRFAGPRLKGFDQWARGNPIASLENVTHFPMALAAVNAYRLENGRLERLSKKLKPVQIHPGAKKTLKLPAAEALLGDNLMVAWMDLDFDSNCASCLEAIDQNIRKGVALAPGSLLHLEAIPGVFDQFIVYKLIVHVRSPYFTARASAVQKKEITLTADDNINENLMLYIPTDKGGDPLLYKYRLEAVTQTGQTRMAPQWEDGRKLTQFFGSSQVEALFNGPIQ